MMRIVEKRQRKIREISNLEENIIKLLFIKLILLNYLFIYESLKLNNNIKPDLIIYSELTAIAGRTKN
jgi:hypothetical protein